MNDRKKAYLEHIRATDWEEEAKSQIKAELKRYQMKYADLATRLSESGMPITEPTLRNKISRGNFSASFFLHCLGAIGCSHIPVGRPFRYEHDVRWPLPEQNGS
jgi:hypothetical protein